MLLFDYSWPALVCVGIAAYVIAALVLGVYTYIVNPPTEADLVKAGFLRPDEVEPVARVPKARISTGRGAKKKTRRQP